MKKFISGMFELDKDIIDIVEYENKNMNHIKPIIEWADDKGVGVTFGTTDDNLYVLQYNVRGETLGYCKGVVSELKALLKKRWKKISVLWQGNGDEIF